MSLLERIRHGTYAADPSVAPKSFTGRSASLTDIAARISLREDILPAVRDFLDQVNRRDQEELAVLIRERPAPSGSARADALLAGVAEHLAAVKPAVSGLGA